MILEHLCDCNCERTTLDSFQIIKTKGNIFPILISMSNGSPVFVSKCKALSLLMPILSPRSYYNENNKPYLIELGLIHFAIINLTELYPKTPLDILSGMYGGRDAQGNILRYSRSNINPFYVAVDLSS